MELTISMEPKNNNQENLSTAGHHENPLRQDISNEQKALNESAHEEAEKDIADDAELSAHNANDDLDEGETARLGEDVPV